MNDQEKAELATALNRMRAAIRFLALEIPESVHWDISLLFQDLDAKIQFLLKES